MWDGTGDAIGVGLRPFISIHPSRVGWDAGRNRPQRRQSTDFNPPIPCGMGRRSHLSHLRPAYISIPPSRVGWDASWRESEGEPSISIHPSRVGWDVGGNDFWVDLSLFQSTHPVWDGTQLSTHSPSSSENFNPPIPCGMGRGGGKSAAEPGTFQSTHPVWDGTVLLALAPHRCKHFNPPIPCGMGRWSDRWYRHHRRFQSTHPVWDGTYGC